MYSHRIVAFVIFTSLFFTSSSLFAALTWFIFSLRSASTLPATDDIHDGIVSPRLVTEKDDETVRAPSLPDDEINISPSGVARRPSARYSSSAPISRTDPPVIEISAREEYRQSYKPRFPSESSATGQSRDEDVSSTMTQIKTDDDLTSQDDDVPTIERRPASEISF
jgi:hypothetical protein